MSKKYGISGRRRSAPDVAQEYSHFKWNGTMWLLPGVTLLLFAYGMVATNTSAANDSAAAAKPDAPHMVPQSRKNAQPEVKRVLPSDRQLAEEPDGDVIKERRFYNGGAQSDATNSYFTHDQLGTVREMSDNAGAIQAQYQYDPYGQTTSIGGTTTAAPFQYAGMYYHQRSGLYLTPFRAYSPALGRWLNRDPLEEAAGVNPFIYAGNSPTRFRDPLGLSPEDVAAIRGSFRDTVTSMTRAGERVPDPGLNNSIITVAEILRQDYPLSGCGAQSKKVRDALKRLKLTDTWTYKYAGIGGNPIISESGVPYKNPHIWVEATSNNPTDPILQLDPLTGSLWAYPRGMLLPLQ